MSKSICCILSNFIKVIHNFNSLPYLQKKYLNLQLWQTLAWTSLLNPRLFDLCLGIEKNIIKEIYVMHFHLMTEMAMPYHKNPCPRGHEIYNFGRPLLRHYFNYLVCLIHAPEKRRVLKKECIFTI